MAISSEKISFKTGSKNILYVIQICDHEAETRKLIIPIVHSTKRASQIPVFLSIRRVYNIRKRFAEKQKMSVILFFVHLKR